MLKPRVSLGSQPKSRVPADLSVEVMDIQDQGEKLDVPSTLAWAVREVIQDRAPDQVELPPDHPVFYTPFILEPAYSGADRSLDSQENRTVITRTHDTVRIQCDTNLIALKGQVPLRIYLTGRELDLPIAGQRCTVDVFQDSEGYTRKLAWMRRDATGHLYVEVQDKGKEWQVDVGNETWRFHFDAIFTLK